MNRLLRYGGFRWLQLLSWIPCHAPFSHSAFILPGGPKFGPRPGWRWELELGAVSARGARSDNGLGMVIGMATRKVTVTLDEADLERVRHVVATGTAPSVSGFVQHAVSVALDDVAGWGALLAEALTKTGGALSDEERAWADDVLGLTSRDKQSAA